MNEEISAKMLIRFLMDLVRFCAQSMLCYVIWLFVKRLSQKAIQRRSQRDSQAGENKSLQTTKRRR